MTALKQLHRVASAFIHSCVAAIKFLTAKTFVGASITFHLNHKRSVLLKSLEILPAMDDGSSVDLRDAF